MYFYFSTDFPSAIKLGGIYFGTAYKSVAFLDIYEPYPLIEILPLSGNRLSSAFFPNSDFLDNPPENATVTDLKGGYFIRFSEPCAPSEFKIINQKKYSGAVITVFIDGGYRSSVETENGFLAETFDFRITAAEFTQKFYGNRSIIFSELTTETGKILNVYDVTIKPELIFSETLSELELCAEGFYTTEQKKDVQKHTVKTLWEITQNGVKRGKRTVTSSENFDKNAIPEKILPYAFLEEFGCGGDVSEYVGGEVKENAEHLKDFFGDFIGVTTPPFFREYDEIGLVYKSKERTYYVEYFTFKVENRKITAITKK